MEDLKTYLDYTIIAVLGGMSFVSVWFAVERYFYFRKFEGGEFTNIDDLRVSLTRNLTIISSIGANAPYIGLLGTVFGIMLTFYDIGESGTMEVKAIMKGLALALKATAMGLVVAIPSIIFYNSLLRQTEVITARWKKETGAS